MIEFLNSLLSSFFGLLGNLLPDSPFAEWATITGDLAQGIGWLNWLVDVGGCLGIFMAWLAVGLAVTIAKLVFVQSKKAFDRSTNWNGGYTG